MIESGAFADMINLGAIAGKKLFGVRKTLEWVFKSLIRGITFTNGDGSSILARISRAIKIFEDVKSCIRGNKLAKALAGLIGWSVLAGKKVSRVREKLGEAFDSPIWDRALAGLIASVIG